MPAYKNILVAKDYSADFKPEVPVYVFNPLEIAGTAFLYLSGTDLYAFISSDLDIGNFYLDFHRTNKTIDILLLMDYDKKGSGYGRIKDQLISYLE